MTKVANTAVRIYSPEEKIEHGIFTSQFLLTGFAVPCRAADNYFNVRKAVLIKNCNPTVDEGGPHAGGLIYVGGPTVSPTTGIPLKPGESISLDMTTTRTIDVFVTGQGIVAIAEFV